MATVRSHDVICRIVKDGILELETEAGCKPFFNGIVVIKDKLLVIDHNECNLQLYNRHYGKLISTPYKLESFPYDACLISKTEVAVCLYNGTIIIMSLKSTDDVKLVKTLRTGFDQCHSLAKLNSDKLVVIGWKDGMKNGIQCWGVLSIRNGRMDSTHDICNGYGTHIAIKDNTVYISCFTDDTITNGVHAYDIFNPHTQKFMYQHQELKEPWSIMAVKDCVYVCDWNSNRIHQLTDSGQLVTIHTVSLRPYGIFYDDQHGLLYTTSYISNLITVYKMESLHQPENLHQSVLNRCLPHLMKDLNVEGVMMYVLQKELFDDVTIHDIMEQTTTTNTISNLVDQIKKRDQDTYERFKECLILAQRADLKIMLEEEEENLAAEMKEKQQDPRASEPKRRSETSATKKSSICLLM